MVQNYKEINLECPLMTSHVFWQFLTYLPTLSYCITPNFGGYSWIPLPTLISHVINGRSPRKIPKISARSCFFSNNFQNKFSILVYCVHSHTYVFFQHLIQKYVTYIFCRLSEKQDYSKNNKVLIFLGVSNQLPSC